jgi:hypothetical protein
MKQKHKHACVRLLYVARSPNGDACTVARRLIATAAQTRKKEGMMENKVLKTQKVRKEEEANRSGGYAQFTPRA